VYESIPTGNLEGVYDRAIAGDFNGDGKTDLMIPKADKTSDWYLYLSTGKGFVKELKTNLSYFSKDQEISNQGVHNTFFESGCAYGTFTYYTYSTDDLDGDGRSEFMALTVTMVNHEWNAHYDNESTNINATIFTTAKSTTSELQFEKQSFVSSNGFRSDSFSSYFSGVVVPFSFTSMYRNGKKAVILGKPENCGKTDCETFIFLEANGFKDISKYSKIKTIAQGGLTTTIDYTELNPTVDANIYGVVKKEAFPYIELDKVSRSYAISQVRQEIIANGENKVRKQDFRYRGLVTHLQGKGMIGFRQTARSSWYTDDFVNTKIWSGAEIDPLNEGLPIKEWSIKTNTESQVFPTDISESNTQLLSFKSTQYKIDKLLNGTIIDINTVSASDKPKIVTAIVPIQSKGKGFLNDITTESTITYGDYYLPHQTVVKTNNDYAINTTTLEYVHNINGTGKDYYVGRPQSKTETVFYSPTSDTKSAKQEYTYNANNLLETLKTYNRDDSGWFLETYTYDDFGNITQKEITNSIDDNTKTDKAEYDAKGRFVLKKTDNLGLETNITYNDWGQVLTQTDTFGNTLTNEYDDWGKLQKSKTNLSGYTSYTYEKFSNGDAVVNEYAPDGGRVITYTNKFGQKYKSAAKAFGQSRFVASEIQFDGLGRKIKESEPYFEDFDGATPSQWNTIEYDDYSRPVKATSFTGKIMQSTYGVRSVKAVETNANNRFKEQKTDPVGKVISTEDLGGIITFKYNAAGENTEADYEGNKVKTSYDAWGNKTRFEDPSNGVYEYKYLGYFGALSESKSPKGKKEYEYNDKGQLIKQKEKSDTGNSTDKVIAFNYNSKGQMISKSGTSLGKPYSSTIAYASNGRLLSSMESSNGKYFIQKDIVYDDKSRVTSYEKSLYSSGVLTKVSIENVYDSWSGELYQVKDKNANKILWELQDANAKGQVTQAKLGGVNVNNSYDNNGFLNSISHVSASNQATVLQISYSFNAIKNELNSRTTGGDFNITEQFQYDDNNRLYNWTDPVTGAFTQNQKRNEYDKRGRIIKNDQLGTVKFENTQKIYQATGMTLNAEGEQNYNNDLIQSIAYNENNDPVYIDGERGDARFEYGLTNMRQVASYGGNFDPDSDGKFTKYYSEDGSYEVIRNNQTRQEKHLIYIGGTPYEANIVYLKNFQEEQAKFVFLHKDYLGSILAITDEAGNKLEQRHFDAWGNLTHLKIGQMLLLLIKTKSGITLRMEV
jgi:YD repeat-containing protein